LLRDDGFLANGTTVIETGKLSEAVGMDRMAAWQILWRLTRRKHVFSADGTVVFILVLEAPMGFENINRNTHTTFRAMTEVFLATDSAEAALVTMERFFGLAHPQITLDTMIFPELNFAIDTLIRCHLPRATEFTNNFSNQEAIHGRVSRRTSFVVTNPAPNHSSAAGRNDIAVPVVVAALCFLLLRQDGRWCGGDCRAASTHEVLDAHAFFLIAERIVSHDCLYSPSPSNCAVFFWGRSSSLVGMFIVLVHMVFAVLVVVLVVVLIVAQIAVVVVFAVHHNDVIIVHIVFFVCHGRFFTLVGKRNLYVG